MVDVVSDPCRLLSGEISLASYDLVLLDVMMPGIDGFSLLEKLREDMDCPVLFLTAKTSEEDVMKGFGLGADDYIRKPFGVGSCGPECRPTSAGKNGRRKIPSPWGTSVFI